MNTEVIWPLLAHFLTLSLLAVGGAISVAPEMHRLVVTQRHWISEADFSNSVALAQAAPGPNVLFVTLVGWHAAGIPGALAATAGIMLPSSLLALMIARVMERHHEWGWIQSVRDGLAPVAVGLTLATAWILGDQFRHTPLMLGLGALAALVVLRTRINPVWVVLAGAVLGWLVA